MGNDALFEEEMPKQGDAVEWRKFYEGKIADGIKMTIPQLQAIAALEENVADRLLAKYFIAHADSLSTETIAEILMPLCPYGETSLLSELRENTGVYEKIDSVIKQNGIDRYSGYCDAVLTNDVESFFNDIIDLRYGNQEVGSPENREEIISIYMREFVENAFHNDFYNEAIIDMPAESQEKVRATFSKQQIENGTGSIKREIQDTLEYSKSCADFLEIFNQIKPERRQQFIDYLKNDERKKIRKREKLAEEKERLQREVMHNEEDLSDAFESEELASKKMATLAGLEKFTAKPGNKDEDASEKRA